MQIMGVILVAAMLVVPVAAAAQVSSSFKQSVMLAVVAAELAAVVGVTVSYVYGVAAGGSIVLAAIAVYATMGVGRAVSRRVVRPSSTRRSRSDEVDTEEKRAVDFDGGRAESVSPTNSDDDAR